MGLYGEQVLPRIINVACGMKVTEPLRRRVCERLSDLCFVWDGTIDGAIDHLRAHAVGVELGPVRRQGARGDGTSVYFRDPDGSLLELISYR